MANVEENINIIKEPKTRGRKPHLNADGSELTIEQKKQRTRERAKKHYENNYEYRKLQKACWFQRKKDEKKIVENNIHI